MSDRIAAGLDFGTSNSAIGVHDGRTARLHRFAGGAEVVPSALFYDFDDEAWSYGREAEARFLDGAHGRYLRALKSVLGTSLMEERTRLGRRAVPFRELIGRFVGALKSEAEAAVGAPLTRVVAGRPVRFSDRHPERDRAAQDALEAALRSVGFEEVAFLPEPVGAAIDAERLIEEPGLALVADIGGGTSDVSVVEVDPAAASRSRVLSAAGVHVGGTDFDRELALRHVMPALGRGSTTRPPMSSGPVGVPNAYFTDLATWQRIPLLYNPRTLGEVAALARHAEEPGRLRLLLTVLEEELGHDLLAAVEGAKIALSAEPRAAIALADLPGLAPTPLDAPALEAALAADAERIGTAVEEALRRAGVPGDAVATLVLTGGSTLLPTVRDAIAARVPEARIVTPDRFSGTAHGLTMEAGRRFLGAA
jgi:hypothetical chaperone protein